MSDIDDERRQDAKRVVGRFAADLIDLFGTPKPPNGSQLSDAQYGKKWLADMIEDLWPFSAETLERARRILRRTTKYKSMPNNSEILTAAKQAYKEIESEKPQLIKPDEKRRAEMAIEEKENLAIELMRAHLGRQAVEEGWHGELFEYVRDNSHLPRSNAEIKFMRDEAVRTDRTIKALFAKDIPISDTLTPVCKGFAESVLGRRDSIKRSIIDGEAFNWGRVNER